MTPRSLRHGPLALAAACLLLAGAASTLLYFALTWWVDAWRYHPEIAQASSAGFACFATLACTILMCRPPRSEQHPDGEEPEGGDSGGGGGPPPRKRPPSPDGPLGTPTDWDSFDRVRAEWERVPALR